MGGQGHIFFMRRHPWHGTVWHLQWLGIFAGLAKNVPGPGWRLQLNGEHNILLCKQDDCESQREQGW